MGGEKWNNSVIIVDENGDFTLRSYSEGTEIEKSLVVGGVDNDGKLKFFKMQDDGKLDIVQTELVSVIHSIYTELKKINIQLSLITDNEINSGEIEGVD